MSFAAEPVEVATRKQCPALVEVRTDAHEAREIAAELAAFFINQAQFVCRGCGVVAHADHNAAVNIARRGLNRLGQRRVRAASLALQDRVVDSPTAAAPTGVGAAGGFGHVAMPRLGNPLLGPQGHATVFGDRHTLRRTTVALSTAQMNRAAERWRHSLDAARRDPHALARWRRRSMDAWREAVAERPTSDTYGRIVAALDDTLTRDAFAMSAVSEKIATVFDADEDSARERVGTCINRMFSDPTLTPDRGAVQAALGVLVEVAERTGHPCAHAAAALLLWWQDERGLSLLQVDRALGVESGHNLARLVAAALSMGIRPAWTERELAV